LTSERLTRRKLLPIKREAERETERERKRERKRKREREREKEREIGRWSETQKINPIRDAQIAKVWGYF
jgi:hypothetical protein